jgi:hypothetical protein
MWETMSSACARYSSIPLSSIPNAAGLYRFEGSQESPLGRRIGLCSYGTKGPSGKMAAPNRDTVDMLLLGTARGVALRRTQPSTPGAAVRGAEVALQEDEQQAEVLHFLTRIFLYGSFRRIPSIGSKV